MKVRRALALAVAVMPVLVLAAHDRGPALRHAQGTPSTPRGERAALQDVRSQSGAGDWPMYNRDLAGTRYSPLTQITPRNVASLTRVWSFAIGRDQTAGTLSGGSEFTPIVVNGTMYAATSDAVVALEPQSGGVIWRHVVQGGVPSSRGVAYWPGEGAIAPRIFFTSERRLIALSASGGEPVAAFGAAGEIDMAVPYHAAPTIYRNLLIVGTNGSPGGVRGLASPRTCWRRATTAGPSRSYARHRDVSTTMICTHVLNQGGRGLRSPLDQLGSRPRR